MKNNQNLDELFKSTFDALPASEPIGAWDTPSANMWTRIESTINTAPPPTPSAGQPLLMKAGIGVLVVGIGLAAWYFSGTTNTVKPQQEQKPVEVTAPVLPASAAPASATDKKVEQAPLEKEASHQEQGVVKKADPIKRPKEQAKATRTKEPEVQAQRDPVNNLERNKLNKQQE